MSREARHTRGDEERQQHLEDLRKGGKPVQVTNHADGNLFFPSISADGKTIVYEDNFGIWKLDTASGKSTEIRIDIKSDFKDNKTELVTIANDAEGFSISPSNRRAAIEVHGEIFTIATGRGEIQRVTETPWKEQDPRWSPNGKWIAFVSDRTGREEIYISDELGKTTKKLTDADCDKNAIVWASDSKCSCGPAPITNCTASTSIPPRTKSSWRATAAISGPAILARWQVDLLFQDRRSPAHPRLVTRTRQRQGDDDRLRPVHDLARRPLDPRWQKAPPHRRQGRRLGHRLHWRAWVRQLFSVALNPIDKDPNDHDINTEEQAEAAEPPEQGATAAVVQAGAARPPMSQ